jgi:serine/threonine-protein kinase
MTKHVAPMISVVPSLPPPVAAVIDRALAYDAAARWPDARAMQAALRAAYQSLGAGQAWGAPAAGQAWGAPSPSQGAVAPQTLGAGAAPPAQRVTGQPVTLVGAGSATPQARGFPVPVLVGGLGGALVTGVIVLLVAARHPSSRGGDTGPAVSASAVVATAVVATTSSAAPTAQPAAEPSASAGPTADPSSVPAGPTSSAEAKPHVPGPLRRPGSVWPGHKR